MSQNNGENNLRRHAQTFTLDAGDYVRPVEDVLQLMACLIGVTLKDAMKSGRSNVKKVRAMKACKRICWMFITFVFCSRRTTGVCCFAFIFSVSSLCKIEKQLRRIRSICVLYLLFCCFYPQFFFSAFIIFQQLVGIKNSTIIFKNIDTFNY
jgi:hypothetical protein